MDNATTPAVRRARPIYRVFVSSTWVDLQPERRALMDALNRMEEMRFVGMEFFGNRPDDTHDASIDQVDLCEVLVGIIGFRYGSGITEAEYRRARELGLPCFVYFKRGDLSLPELTDGDAARATKLTGFKAKLLHDHTVKEFSSPEELAANATADLHNWVAARWISLDAPAPAAAPASAAPPDADRTNILRLLERIQHDWVEGVLEASLHHRAWLELGLDWKDSAVEHPWDRIVVAANRPIQTLSREDSITGVFASAQNTLLVLGEPGAGKTTTLLELLRELIKRARGAAVEPAPVVLALSTWTGAQRKFSDWLVLELGLRYQVPKRIAQAWLDDARLVLLLDGLDEVPADRRAACVEAINAFEAAHHPPGLAVTCRVAEYEALTAKLRLRAAICLQPLAPQQIERYFAAAGPRLEHLRRAMRDDEGLGELARTPLMLSVMTMAWGGAPPGGEPTAGTGTIEQRRKQLFEAYVQTAIKRHGKSSGGYTAAQTVGWLAWLARRMKAHQQTMFAVEQLQPGWLDGARSQFGYIIVTRLLGTMALALPLLVLKTTPTNRLGCAVLAMVVGLVIGTVDYFFLRRSSCVGDQGSRRFWLTLAAEIGLGVAWVFVAFALREPDAEPPIGYGLGYLAMAALAFCTPVDVRTLDIRPSDSMRWSWRQAVERFGVGLVGLNLLVSLGFGSALVAMTVTDGWSVMTGGREDRWFLAGVLVGAVAGVLYCARLWRKGRVFAVAVGCATTSLGGQLGAVVGQWDISGAIGILLEFLIAASIGVFGGFAAGMVDPMRARRSGIWFWLRVPVLAFVVVGLLMIIPGIVAIVDSSHASGDDLQHVALGSLVVGASAGLVAFFRFGGFNGLQHGVLRWLLVRSGNLPPKAEAFYNHAARLALMQKVGFGYRFIHALLLDHLAARAPETEKKTTPSAS